MRQRLQQRATKRNHQYGFTLVEVLIALVVVGVAIAALLEGMGSYALYHSQLRERFWSQNIAWNELSKITVAQEVGKLKSITANGSAKQLGVTWTWKITKEKTNADTVTRLDIRVSPKKGETGTRLSTMILRGAGFSRSQLSTTRE